MAGRVFLERRGLLFARLSGIGAAGVEPAARGGIDGGGDIPFQHDALAGAAENIGKLLARKHYYFVPFGQDDAAKKPTSMVADFAMIPQAMTEALAGRQIQPILL